MAGTGWKHDSPHACTLTDTPFIQFEGQQISGFDGNSGDVAAARAYYRFVAEKHGIDTSSIHSWLGIRTSQFPTHDPMIEFAWKAVGLERRLPQHSRPHNLTVAKTGK